MSTTRRRRSTLAPVLSAAVVILGGFGIAMVEAWQLPKASIWIVVAGAVILIAAIRVLSRPRR
jgi:membrane protein YdbS with pleckstrin-like domain